MKFSKSTKIITIGHLRGHTEGKVSILMNNGFTDVSAILCEETPVDQIKAILTASPNSMFLVGGAMMNGFPELMEDLLSFIEKDCSSILVHKTVKSDFDEGITFPPSEQDVNKSALNICNRLVAENVEMP
jgi:hypothetical protein